MKTIRKLKNTKTRRNYFKIKKNSTKNLHKKKIGGKQTQNLRKINCSPKSKDELNDFSCYTNKSLIELRDRWNARHPDVKINTNSPKEIHQKLSEF